MAISKGDREDAHHCSRTIQAQAGGITVIVEPPFDPDAIRSFVDDAHRRNAALPVMHPDRNGAFPGSWLQGIMRGGEVYPVVPDTNVLLRDIARTCRKGRTVLITAANAGAIRLFSPQHVHEEVIAHSSEWADRSGVSAGQFLDVYDREYLPLMRTIDRFDVSVELLTPEERGRVALLNGSNDVPAVVLSLVLGAFFLTEDQAARRIVYDVAAEPEDLRTWRRVLMQAGDANALESALIALLVVPGGVVAGAAQLVRSLLKMSPAASIPIVATTALLAALVPRDTYAAVGGILGRAASFTLDVSRLYYDALHAFDRAMPASPSWGELATTLERRMVLGRASLHKLARCSRSLMTAREISEALRALPVGHGAQLVRDAMRRHGCFVEPYKGHWQVGHAVNLTPAAASG